MICNEIGEKLQSFLDDLLSEKDYKAFCDHLNTCPRCEKHVRSIGSLSNQLWKLGKVHVPEDLVSTALYKYRSFEAERRSAAFVITRRHMLVAFAVALVIGAFFVTHYFKNKKADVPVVSSKVIQVGKTPSDEEAKNLLKQLETIAEKLNASGSKDANEVFDEEQAEGAETSELEPSKAKSLSRFSS